VSQQEKEIVSKLLAGKSAAEIFCTDSADISFERIKELESLVRNESPIIRMKDNGKASELNYNVPNSTAYIGYGFIVFNNPNLEPPYNWFKVKTPASTITSDPSWATVKNNTSMIDTKIANIKAVAGSSIKIDKEVVTKNLNNGYRPVLRRTSAGTNIVVYAPITAAKPRIIFKEIYSLSSFLGDYGAAKTLKTFTLLPGEKTTISMKTWKSTETTTKQASSILDSYSRDSSDSFEDSVQNESSSKEANSEASEWHAEASVSASFWGLKASASGGAKGSSNISREEMSKNVASATSKHVANASSKRSIDINTSFEAKTVAGEEESTVRQLENINVGRVLNFVFRQLNQKYTTYFHLIDVKLVYVDGQEYENVGGFNPHYKEYALSDLERFISTHIDPTAHENIRNMIVDELTSITDYCGYRKEKFVECVNLTKDGPEALKDPASYLDETQRIDPETGKQILYLRVTRDKLYTDDEDSRVNGIILSKNDYVLPTDSVIIEALLGQAEALDKYSVDSRRVAVSLKEAEIERLRLANMIIQNKDEQMADLYTKIFMNQPTKSSE
jgi:hypothetical protein